MSDKKQFFRIGDEVSYSAKWLRATGNRVGPIWLIHVSWFLNGKPYRVESEYHDDGHVKRLAADAALANGE